MEGSPSFNTESDESDNRFRELLKARGFEGPTAESIIDRTRGDEEARQKWYKAYGHLIEPEQTAEDSSEEPA